MYECPGCESRLKQSDLIWPIPDVEEIILPGDVMPEGLCPYCDEPVYRGEDEIDA